MKVALTGASGFVGRHLLQELLARGFEVKVFKRKTSRIRQFSHQNLTFVSGNFSDIESLKQLVCDVDYVIHCAGVIKTYKSEKFIEGNFISTRNLVDAINSCNKELKRFVFISSQAAQGPSRSENELRKEDDPPEPVSWYGKSKLMAENYILNHIEVPYTIFRPSAVYGEGDRETFRFFKYAKLGIFVMPGGDMFLNMIYVKDLIDVIIKSLTNNVAENKVYFVADGIKYRLGEIGDFLKELMKKEFFLKLTIPLIPLLPVFSISEFFSRLFKKPTMVNRDKLKELKEKYWLGSTEKIEKELNFRAKFNIYQGFPVVYKWYKENHWL